MGLSMCKRHPGIQANYRVWYKDCVDEYEDLCRDCAFEVVRCGDTSFILVLDGALNGGNEPRRSDSIT